MRSKTVKATYEHTCPVTSEKKSFSVNITVNPQGFWQHMHFVCVDCGSEPYLGDGEVLE